MSLLFTHAYYLSDDLKEQKIMKPYPPLGLLYVSAYIQNKNIANDVFDTTFSSFEKQLAFIEDKKPKIKSWENLKLNLQDQTIVCST